MMTPMGETRYIDYIARTRDYYGALGYAPYQWAQHEDVPFAALSKPLAESRLVLITTAAPYREALGDQGPGAPYNAAAKFFEVYTTAMDPPPDLRISHIGYDRAHTTAEDPATWLPIGALAESCARGTVGAIAEDVIGIPTNRSQRVTREHDAVAALAHCRRLAADVALLVPT